MTEMEATLHRTMEHLQRDNDKLRAELEAARSEIDRLVDAWDCSGGVHGPWCREWKHLETRAESAEAELKEINAVMEGREYGGAVSIIEDFYNIMEALPERFDTDDLVVSVAVASIVAELEAARDTIAELEPSEKDGWDRANVLADRWEKSVNERDAALTRAESAEAERDAQTALRRATEKALGIANKAHDEAQRRIAEALALYEANKQDWLGFSASTWERRFLDILRGEKGVGVYCLPCPDPRNVED